MKKKTIASKFLALMLLALLALSLAACGGEEGGTGASGEPKNAQEAAKVYSDLMDQENAIFSENTALWEKVFLAADKGMAMLEDGKNYGDFLLSTIESIQDQFTAEELELLRGQAKKISDIENQLTALEEKFPDIAENPVDDAMSVPGDSDMAAKITISAIASDFGTLQLSRLPDGQRVCPSHHSLWWV